MSDAPRAWWQHLRLLPGGEQGVGAALALTGTLYFVLMLFGWGAAAGVTSGLGVAAEDLGAGGTFALGNGLPCLVVSLWTGLRVRLSRPLELDEAAADLERRRVLFGDEHPRAPARAFVVSTRPRQVSARMQDARTLTAFFRVNTDPDDLLRLGHFMRGNPGLTVEDWVQGVLARHAKELLPDPDGIREAVVDEVLKRGVVVTRCEVT